MTVSSILIEVKNLHGVSTRLNSLADHYPVVSDGLLAISASVRDNATLLEVLVATKLPPTSGLQ
ncbi:MAG: hypothetical protein LAO56_25230 [Acidobacteriia bacterium]|nr:hypothetical protein [Terriglobia bacterium]